MLVNKYAAVHCDVVKEFGVKPVQFLPSIKEISKLKLLCIFIFSSVLLGCSGTSGKAPVVDRSHAARTPVTSGHYVVRRGDTLYSIAFRFGWDWKALAARNGIRGHYLIVPGQTIRFSGGAPRRAVAKAATPIARKPIAKTSAVPSARKPVVVAQTTPVQKTQPVRTVTTTKQTAKPVAAVTNQGKWLWPTDGALVGVFSSTTSLNKGIDIAGELGQSIVATANGSVVYAGSGLRGYGELVIIKHNDTFISAYGHNRRLLVNEGQTVKAGQKIAEMGFTGTNQVKVHFEIRRQGKPVDPLQYLPKR